MCTLSAGLHQVKNAQLKYLTFQMSSLLTYGLCSVSAFCQKREECHGSLEQGHSLLFQHKF